MKVVVRLTEELMFFYTAFLALTTVSILCFVGVLLTTFLFSYIGMKMTDIPVDQWPEILNNEEHKKNLEYAMWTLTPYKISTWILMIWAMS